MRWPIDFKLILASFEVNRRDGLVCLLFLGPCDVDVSALEFLVGSTCSAGTGRSEVSLLLSLKLIALGYSGDGYTCTGTESFKRFMSERSFLAITLPWGNLTISPFYHSCYN